jgi:hypothetical protein
MPVRHRVHLGGAPGTTTPAPRYQHTGIGTLTFDVNVGSSSSSSLSKQGSAVVSAVTAGTKPAIAEVRALAAARVRLLRALALTPMVIVRVV